MGRNAQAPPVLRLGQFPQQRDELAPVFDGVRQRVPAAENVVAHPELPVAQHGTRDLLRRADEGGVPPFQLGQAEFDVADAVAGHVRFGDHDEVRPAEDQASVGQRLVQGHRTLDRLQAWCGYARGHAVLAQALQRQRQRAAAFLGQALGGQIGLRRVLPDAGELAAPAVYDGVLYAINGKWTFAIDVETGRQLWRTAVETEPGVARVTQFGSFTRGGPTLYNGKLYRVNIDNVIVALDMKTGKEVWKQKFADWREGYYATGAPIVANGVLISGMAGGESTTRGFLDGWDPETGKKLWRRYTIPAPGEPGHETWPADSDSWTRGGGATWPPWARTWHHRVSAASRRTLCAIDLVTPAR